MTHHTILSCLLVFALLLTATPIFPYTYQHTSSSAQIRWTTQTITVAFSTSLSSPPANIKPGSDVIGAARRALRRWADATNIQFVETSSDVQAVSPTNAGDRVNLLTVSPVNSGLFIGERPGRTRVLFDPSSGALNEADVAINPNLPFSTDGSSDTYDLEATFVHEIGHFLGLEHSGVVGATMQPRQGRNYSDRFTTMRTLSDDDLAGIRSIYGRRDGAQTGSLAGRVNNYGAGAHVWAENASTGRVEGSSITRSDGSYRIDQLSPGQYHINVEYLDEPVLAAEITSSRGPYTGIGGQPPFLVDESQAAITAGATTTLNFNVSLSPPSFNPRALGVNGILTTVSAPLAAGRTYRFYIGGEGLEQIPATGITVTSPFMSIDPASRAQENFGTSYPVYSFNLIVQDNAKVGDYSIRVQSNSGEVNYLSGALALDPYTDYVELNALENNVFFVTQQYLDFLFRQPEANGLQDWLNVLNGCTNNTPDCDRVTVSAAFFQSQEFQLKGFFVYRFYKLAFNRSPTYAEIIPDLNAVTGQTSEEVYQRRAAFAAGITQRPEFRSLYDALSNQAYMDALMNRYNLSQIMTIDPANPDTGGQVTFTRAELINRLNANQLSRAQVLRAIVESSEVAAREYNPAFVAMQYFGYLKRDPEQGGYDAWLNLLNANPQDFRTMVNGFANSVEYRSRFGQP